MTDLPDVQAEALPGGDRIEVLRFDRRHERAQLGPHRHRDLELMYFERGGGTHRLGSRRYDADTGDVLLITPGLVHHVTDLGDAAGWAVEFDPHAAGLSRSTHAGRPTSPSLPRMWWTNPLLAPFLRGEQHPTAARFTIPEQQRHVWTAHLRLMHDEHAERRVGYREMISAYLQILLVALSRVAVEYHQALLQRGEPTLAHVFEVIERRYAEPLSTSDVARAVGLTPGHLTTLVRQRTGRTIGEWITERRMAAARDLLVSTDLPAEHVAGRVGYADAAYFSRRFRQVHGVPPRSWRSEAGR